MSTPKQPTTQDNVPVSGIKDGIVVLRNGQYRIILTVSAINFDLKSEQEQNSIVFNYQSFLNSLHFPIEIVVSSKKLDLTPYLNKIKKLSAEQKNELLKIQTDDYIDFVGQLINMANIMKKTFYVAVGYQPLTTASTGIFDKLFAKKDAPKDVRVSEEDFNRYAGELRQRANTVAQGLGSIGLHCRQMNTQEIIELLYGIYNPEVAGKERLSEEAENFSSTFVTQATSAKPAEEAETAPQGEITIDNTEVVAAQQKKEQAERQQEIEKEAEKGIKAPVEQAKPADTGAQTKKTDLTTIQSVPTGQGADATESKPAAVVEDVKEPGVAPAPTAQQPATPATATKDPAAEEAANNPGNTKDFGW